MIYHREKEEKGKGGDKGEEEERIGLLTYYKQGEQSTWRLTISGKSENSFNCFRRQ